MINDLAIPEDLIACVAPNVLLSNAFFLSPNSKKIQETNNMPLQVSPICFSTSQSSTNFLYGASPRQGICRSTTAMVS